MNEYLPYEEELQQQLSDLPLPDEDMAWADMKRRLEEEEDRKPFFFWLRGCAGWALLGLLVLGLGWWLLKPLNWFRNKQDAGTVAATEQNQEPVQKDTTAITKGIQPPSPGQGPDTVVTLTGSSKDSSLIGSTGPSIKRKEKTSGSKDGEVTTTSSETAPRKKIAGQPVRPKDKIIAKHKQDNEKRPAADTTLPGRDMVSREPAVPGRNEPAVTNPDSVSSLTKTLPPADPVKKIVRDTVRKAPDSLLTRENKPRKDSAKSNKWAFSAGIGMHQQIPLSGQKLTPYNSLGRKGSLADYIPSVYIRAGRENKWFLQAEFRYGAPQYTKQFTYRQASVPDTGSNPVFSTITSFGLKKTFYHQLPLTFNYLIRPGWSVGAGFQWNLFKSAVSERSVSRKNNFTQRDSLVSKDIRTDDTAGSVFRKSYWQAVAETQYKWKRFSIGAKYAFGLEPYIRFALPGQPVREERNHALQVFIRYELWRSPK